MKTPVIFLTYCIFFFSGAAALIYEIVWTRYLGLVFGGSHLAVSTVLAVFMAGLALGSYFIGRRIDSHKYLLRLFGYLELGVGASALLFVGLMRIYPPVYIKLAQFAPESPLYLSVVRVAFAVLALIIPTTLMGGTLPVLTTFSSRLLKGAGVRLSFLYGCNTLGAVCGAAATGFILLRSFSMGKTLATAMVINLFIGLTAILLQRRVTTAAIQELLPQQEEPEADTHDLIPFKLVLWGIGVSGFCAMGYEILWNRILSIVIGASTYGFTLLLIAFLSGIGAGSASCGLFFRIMDKLRRQVPLPVQSLVTAFGSIQVIIGITTLLATVNFRYLPSFAAFLHDYFLANQSGNEYFQMLQIANLVLAFAIMFTPAFFMGVSFPLAGTVHCRYRRKVGYAIGELLSFNTIGAILGAVASGYILIYLFGIQRSLQIMIITNIGYGLLVITSIRGGKLLGRLTALAFVATLLIPICSPGLLRIWDPKIYAVYQSNKPEAYGSAEEIREMLANMDVRYYAEGTQSIVSAVQSTDTLFFITNGRVEASNAHQDMQCQYLLGHLPMLLHKNPRKVFVLGTGSGMTLGAVSVHPSVEKITLAEIEPAVLGVARVFGIDNHYVLNKPDPRLKVVFNDGRNHLLTTRDRFDVITADPVHPWFSGAGYLYSTEYFRLASQRLNPGGIICQWLPLYELTTGDLQSVVRTIRESFAYTMIWVTHYDAEIIASNSPIIINEQELTRRFATPEISGDLRQIRMGSAEDFLSYFVMGNEGSRAFSRKGKINTDDNLYLEFSAPRSIGMEFLRGTNLANLLQYREKLLPYLQTAENAAGRSGQTARWEANHQAALLEDKAHVLDVSGQQLTYEFTELAAKLENRYPRFAPWRFTREESGNEQGGTPSMLQELEIPLLDEHEAPIKAQFMAILVRKHNRLARVFFVDDITRTVFGKLRVRGTGRDAYIEKFVAGIFKEVQTIYTSEAAEAAVSGKSAPSLLTVFPKIKTLVEARIDQE